MLAPREGGRVSQKQAAANEVCVWVVGGSQSNTDVGIEKKKKNDLFGNTFGPI